MRSTDLTKLETSLTQGLPMTGDPLPGGKPKQVTPPTAVISPPSPTQPNIRFPNEMAPRQPAATPGMDYNAIRAAAAKYGMG
jgi:hypothetical protein